MILSRKIKEEIANSITHGIGVLLAISALVLMVVYASLNGNITHIVSACVFGSTLVILYLASTLYHAIQKKSTKQILNKIDHLAIYLLIAGTYTPFTLITLNGAWGWTVFGIIWGLVILGFIFKLSPFQKNEKVSLALYLLMGWLIIIAAKPLFDNLPSAGVWLIVLGGLSYTIGTYFYAKDNKPYYHAIWHLFVLGGSIFHFFSIFFYVIP